MKTLLSIVISISVTLLAGLSISETAIDFDKSTPVSQVLKQLGDDPIQHQPNTGLKGVSAAVGADLALEGIATNPNGKKTDKQSNHFVCTSCHNIEREDPDLSIADPQARLEYVSERGMPFLQGSPLHGIVNRTKFYNEDYYKKYGTLVDSARDDLRESIQLCAVECSQGRRLEAWELESVLAWLWTLELKMDDLVLSKEDEQLIQSGNKEAIALIKSKYLDYSPASFIDPPKDRTAGADNVTPDPENGKLVYEASCLHCHENQRYSFFDLDYSKDSFRHLKKHFPKYTRYSPYQVIRYGTPPMNGKKAYMPHYTEEKMSKQQVEDLKAYVYQQAE